MPPDLADEQAFTFDCEGERLLGILHRPVADACLKDCGVVIVVGGPQYRAGSHRQFVQLGRALARHGVPVLRFDLRGMGDSGGDLRGFEDATPDIAAAIDAFCRHCPSVRRVVLWGLCDGASAALLYLHDRPDTRVTGLCLANPWVRTAAGLARSRLKHYYVRRLGEREFWVKLLRGHVAWRALRDLFGNLRHLLRTGSKVSTQTTFQSRMASTWQRYAGRILLLLSGEDLTAREFLEYTALSADWSGALVRDSVERVDLSGADHTFSQTSARLAMESATLRWMDKFT